ncbi:hypothetical protein NEOLEDRAFT_1142978 [Neolentinus lepideus HHB14362 ss-1]|uniref:O-methyltransferase C-terminal domain-containing protein n=1 Tax=Neolentinus lepideus HHB14362 ss-1 TaxID=1314782 RepID=A0A165MSZ9_9AGAM|nr:hypothetical protein NEOLEDRAFT_1142978 [Neolentinus lepideus HHB14362 ss-1]
MTIADLRALHAIIGDAIADIEHVYASYNRKYEDEDDSHDPHWRSPSPASSESSYYSTSTSFDSSRPSTPTHSSSFPTTPLEPLSPIESKFPNIQIQLDSPFSLGKCSSRRLHTDFADRVHMKNDTDFPSLFGIYDPNSPAEKLTAHPEVASATKRIVAACGQMGVMVQVPFLTLCDGSMGYHLPSCLRFLEASHTVEILRDAGKKGMHVNDIAAKNGCDVGKLTHILRLLATHHFLTEVSADTFAVNRVSSAMDTGKPWQDILASPEKKYEGTKGVAAFVAMCSDELFKAAAWMTDTFLPPAINSIVVRTATPTLLSPQSPSIRASSPLPPLTPSTILGPAAPILRGASSRHPRRPSGHDFVDCQDSECSKTMGLSGFDDHIGLVGGAETFPCEDSQLSESSEGISKRSKSSWRELSPPKSPYRLASPWSPMSPPTSRHPRGPSNFLSTDDLTPPSPIISRRTLTDYNVPGSPISLRQPSRTFLPASPVVTRPRSHSRHPSCIHSPSPPRLLSPKSSFSSLSPRPLSPKPSLTSLSLKFPLNSPPPSSEVTLVNGVSDADVHLSNSPTRSPFNTAFRTEKEFFAWLEEKGNVGRLKRFGCAMTGSGGWEDVGGGGVLAFPWDTLPTGSLVVDVGGGIGSTSLLLAKKFENLRFVVQDRVGVVKMGEDAWRERAPELLDGGRVMFLAHDFFTPQPTLPVPPAVFLLRVITHDWPDDYARKILLNLRRAALDGEGDVKTRLVVADHVLPLACEDLMTKGTAEEGDGLVEIRLPSWRPPLLSNLGKASANAYWMDLTMRCMFNSQERTLREMITLLESAGWKAMKMSRAEGSLFGCIIAEPCEIPSATLIAEEEEQARLKLQAAEEAERERSWALSMGDTFGSRVYLPDAIDFDEGVFDWFGFRAVEFEREKEREKEKKRARRRKAVSCMDVREFRMGREEEDVKEMEAFWGGL